MLYSDKPIKEPGQDLFDRKAFARNLGSSLINYSSEEGLCIGLLGEWGSGKTSLINMAINYMEESSENKKKPMIMRFDPWNIQNSDQIISQFFLQFVNEFEPEDKKMKKRIGRLIKKYASMINLATYIPDAGTHIVTVGPYILKILKNYLLMGDINDKSIDEQKKLVIDNLKQLENNIIVVIDDIDRLGNDQIRCVFQLIMSICNFPKMIYLVAFDRAIVGKALDKVQEGDGDKYLEKVIQLPINIPPLSKEDLNNDLSQKLKQLYYKYPDMSLDNDCFREIYDLCLTKLIASPRSINRFINMLDLKLSNTSRLIEFSDMAFITAIELEEPGLFEWIKNEELLFDCLRQSQTDKSNIKQLFQDSIQTIDNYSSRLSVDDLFSLIGKLFPYYIFDKKNNPSKNINIPNNRIGCSDMFGVYIGLNTTPFYYPISNSKINYLFFDASQEEWEEYIKLLLDRGEVRAFIKTLIDMNEIKQLDHQRIITILNVLINEFDKLVDVYWNGSQLIDRLHPVDLIVKLVAQLDYPDNYKYLKDLIENMSQKQISGISWLLNQIKDGNNQQNGIAQPIYKQLNSSFWNLDNADSLMELYVNRIRLFLDKEELFELTYHNPCLTLLNSFDKVWVDYYYDNHLKQPKTIISFLSKHVHEIPLSNDPLNFHNYELIMNFPVSFIERIDIAIKTLDNNKQLYQLDKKLIYAIAIFEMSKDSNYQSQKFVFYEPEINEWIANHYMS